MKSKFLYFLLLLIFSSSPGLASDVSLSEKSDNFVNYMVKEHHFNRDQLRTVFKNAHYNEEVIHKITHPYESQPWNVYRDHLLTQQRITDGVQYWKDHQKVLHYAEEKYGVPASIIVAIIGIESDYGKKDCPYSALEALGTLAFYYEPRSKFFTHELVHLFLLTDEYQLPISNMKSSYAGAIGIPQFMPSTYRHYAVNYQSNHADLINNNEDAIVSIANYLHLNGWKAHQSIATDFKYKTIEPRWLSDKAIPKISVQELKKMDIHPNQEIEPSQKAALISLTHSDNTSEYWMTFHNFRSIMRYNPRITYAMAVYQLSRTVEKIYKEQVP